MVNEIITLTDEEKKRFIAWLAQEVYSIELIVGQLQKMGGMEGVVRVKRAELLGLSIVHKMLQSFEAIEIDTTNKNEIVLEPTTIDQRGG